MDMHARYERLCAGVTHLDIEIAARIKKRDAMKAEAEVIHGLIAELQRAPGGVNVPTPPAASHAAPDSSSA